MLGRFSQVTLWTVVLHAPQSMGFSRQEYWSGLPYPPPGDLPNPGTESSSSALQADSLPLSHKGDGLSNMEHSGGDSLLKPIHSVKQ